MPRIRVVLALDMAQLAGAELHVEALVRHLDREQFEPFVLTLQDGPLHERLERARIAHQSLGLGERPGIRSLRPLAEALRRISPDVLHLHQPRAMLLGVIAGRWVGVRRIILTLHSTPRAFAEGLPDGPQRWIKQVVHSVGAALACRLADRIIAVSSAVLGRRLARHTRRAIVIPNGVSSACFEVSPLPDTRNALGISEKATVMLSVGYLHPLKGYEELTEAFARLAPAHPALVWVVVGRRVLPGFADQLVARLSAEGLDDRVRWLGAREDVPELMACSDMLVLASREEAFGRVLIEAMAAGKPVVATRVGGIPEVITAEVDGLLVEPRSPEQLGKAISRLVADPELASILAARGHETARKRFDQSVLIKQVEVCYLGSDS